MREQRAETKEHFQLELRRRLCVTGVGAIWNASGGPPSLQVINISVENDKRNSWRQGSTENFFVVCCAFWLVFITCVMSSNILQVEMSFFCIGTCLDRITAEAQTVLLTVRLRITLVNDQLDSQLFYFIILLLHSSTCFEQSRTHHQEVKLY